MSYKDIEARRAYHREYRRRRYATNAQFRELVKEEAKRWTRANPEKRALIDKRRKQKDKIRNPMRLKAHDAVRQKVYRKLWPAASELLCSICGNQADHYHHHFGYEQAHWYDVVPVCRKCHEELHRV